MDNKNKSYLHLNSSNKNTGNEKNGYSSAMDYF